jgi:hypothetical protein
MISARRAVRLTAALLGGLAIGLPAHARAAAEGAVSYEKESEQAFRRQLAARQIAAATINKRIRTLRLTLKDGRYVKARYPAHTEPRVARELRHAGVKVSVLSKAAAESEAKKAPRHHKIRYIVGGVVVALVVVAGAVFLVRRRRSGYSDY